MRAAQLPGVVWFVTPGESGDPGPHFAIRRADRQWWAANAYRGFRLCGLQSRRFPPQLVGSHGRRVPVEIVHMEEMTHAA